MRTTERSSLKNEENMFMIIPNVPDLAVPIDPAASAKPARTYCDNCRFSNLSMCIDSVRTKK